MIQRNGKKAVQAMAEGRNISSIWSSGRRIWVKGDLTPKMVLVCSSSSYTKLNLSYYLLNHIRNAAVDAMLDWGDGSQPLQLLRNSQMEDTPLIHQYATPGQYRVTITGIIGWSGSDENHSYYSESLPTWLDQIELPTGISPIRWKNARAFYRCYKLSNLPPGLYNYIPDATDFSYDFTDAPIGKIPKNFFKYCKKGTNFTKTFASSHLTAIDEEIFNNLQPYNLDSCFEQNEGITGKLPELWNTFKHNTTHTRCFTFCSNATNYAEAIAAGWA